MNYLIDIIILFIIALFTFISYKKGLIKVVFHLVSFVLAILIAIVLYKPVSNLIINYTSIDDKIEETIEARLSSPDITQEESENILANYYTNMKNVSSITAARTISTAIINASCMIIVFLISKIILLFFRFSGDLIAKLPLIKQINGVGGFIYGLLKGFVIVYILLAIVAILSPVIEMNGLLNLINSSIIANIMYNNNIIFVLFT